MHALNSVRIRDIRRLLIRRKANPIRLPEPIRHNPNIARPGLGVVAVHLTRQFRQRPEGLLEAITRVREPDRAIRMDDDVIDGIEPAPVVIVHDRLGFIGRVAGHVDEASRVGVCALGAEEDTILVVDPAIAHRHVGTDFFAFVLISYFTEFGDLDVLMPGYLVSVACDENFAGEGYIDARLVREWVGRVGEHDS